MKFAVWFLKALLLIFLTIVFLFMLSKAIIYYADWARTKDVDSWPQRPIHNIRINDSHWQAFDIGLPPEPNIANNKMEYEVAIPNRYQLTRDHYIIDIEINPTRHGTQTNMQIVAQPTSETGDRYLKVELNWDGQCGMILNPESHFITNKNAIGFAIERHRKNCNELKQNNGKLVSPLVINPIKLKIYDDATLIGEEQINFEVFYNGINKYLVPF